MKKLSEMTTEEHAVWTLRFLAADAIERAKSGHPGITLGAADVAFVLWNEFLRFSSEAPEWPGRDRFVLSAGHGSALLYALLHLYGYLSLEDLRSFRQLGSRTPGHPEHGLTPGVEMTTGPLGQGFAAAVGMALASKMLSARLKEFRSKVGFLPTEHRVFCLTGDGDMMEGITSEAASLAGHLNLGNLIVVYDQNSITIDGSTKLAFTEHVGARFRAHGWRVMDADGHNRADVGGSLHWATRTLESPALICAGTKIGFGSALEGSNKSHGSPLGEELAEMKEKLGWPPEPFHVPDDVHELFEMEKRRRGQMVRDWEAQFGEWRREFPEGAAFLEELKQTRSAGQYLEAFVETARGLKKNATREHSGVIIQTAAELVPGLVGGAADLSGNIKTTIRGSGVVAPRDYEGRNICYGVREHGMCGIMNGLALGGLVPFGGTFLVFSDYALPAITEAAMMGLRVIYVFSHDSFYVGKDGGTHQPVGQAARLRSIPGLAVIRPADALETAAAWALAMGNTKGPTAILLTRQEVPELERPEGFQAKSVLRGGYVLHPGTMICSHVIIGTGSEVALALHAGKALGCRVVSMPSVELFLMQDQAYRDSVIPPTARVAVIEASNDSVWYRFTGKDGLVIGMTTYGESGSETDLAKHFGFTSEAVQKRVALWMEAK
ncbi:MAG: transketolase [bacterium]